MSGTGAPQLSVTGARGLRVAVAAAQWHATVMDGLIGGARRALTELGLGEPTLVRVPGSFELPVAARALADEMDGLISAILRYSLVAAGVPAGLPPFALAATGGYGRGTLAPYSDIDLLFVSDAPLEAPGRRAVAFQLMLRGSSPRA